MSNIIILEDDPNRIATFKKAWPLAIYHTTASGCIKAITDSQDIDKLFLDHDLGGEAWVNSLREDCGMEVVRFLIQNPKPIKEIIVHSHNTPAGLAMSFALKKSNYRVRYTPFGLLCRSFGK